MAGLTVRQAELMLEEKYTKYYKAPFVLLTVSNRRVVVFPGGGGDAKIIPLENNNTTLLEALANAGGIAKRGDAHRVKLFRRQPDGTRKVFQFDLSRHRQPEVRRPGDAGRRHGVCAAQPRTGPGLLTEITPLITLLTSTVLVIGSVRTIGN
jgi:polysaccharide export outer membrane protein